MMSISGGTALHKLQKLGQTPFLLLRFFCRSSILGLRPTSPFDVARGWKQARPGQARLNTGQAVGPWQAAWPFSTPKRRQRRKFVQVDLPPWFSVLSIALNSNVDLDVSRIETAPQSMLPIICFRDGSPPLPDALSMANSAISASALVIETMEALTVLLGDMGAGKTILVLRFVKGQFSEYQESTIGAAFFTQVLSLNEATERYYSLAPMYYRGADAAIVVYDITSMESFARAKKWVQQVQRHANPSLIMFLVANKADLGAERKVANEDGEEYAKENGLSFLETSAKTAQNVNKLFYEIAKRLAKANPSRQTGIKLHSIPQETRRSSLFCCV
ncbi:Ras-related protein [Arachis hypogaea]|nr:Ras-related protein [Arachis hypogaea]